MSTVYLQNSVTGVSVGPTGHQHERAAGLAADAPTEISCVDCEPFLVREGAVYQPEQVPLTAMQEREQTRIEREGNMAVKVVAEALADTAARQLAAGSAAKVRRAPAKKSTAQA